MSHDEDPEAPGPAVSAPEAAPEEERGLEPVPRGPAAELEELKKERDDLRDQLLRRRAEFENYRRRVERDRQQAGVEAVAGLLKALVPTLDNLDRALESAEGGAALRDGIELVRRDLLALLQAQGVKVDEPLGERFDPNVHQALAHEHVPGKAEGTIVEVYRKGYSYRERLLRPAWVKVAKAEDGAPEPGPEAVH